MYNNLKTNKQKTIKQKHKNMIPSEFRKEYSLADQTEFE